MLKFLSEQWRVRLKNIIEANFFIELSNFVENSYTKRNCSPDVENIFSAFNNCLFDDIKVVIIGQDPYPTLGDADGMCFSYLGNSKQFPKSLTNILKEVKDDIGKTIITSGSLLKWAKQGVLLLNSILTIETHSIGSHKNKGWEKFTDEVLKLISTQKKGIVYLLWGNYAKQKAKLISTEQNLILTSGHPSPLSANRGFWFGNKHFSKTNEYLINHANQKKIIW